MQRDQAPRCGLPVRRNERAGPVVGDPACGRPAAHNGPCLSAAAWTRKLAGNARWMTRNRQEARRAA